MNNNYFNVDDRLKSWVQYVDQDKFVNAVVNTNRPSISDAELNSIPKDEVIDKAYSIIHQVLVSSPPTDANLVDTLYHRVESVGLFSGHPDPQLEKIKEAANNIRNQRKAKLPLLEQTVKNLVKYDLSDVARGTNFEKSKVFVLELLMLKLKNENAKAALNLKNYVNAILEIFKDEGLSRNQPFKDLLGSIFFVLKELDPEVDKEVCLSHISEILEQIAEIAFIGDDLNNPSNFNAYSMLYNIVVDQYPNKEKYFSKEFLSKFFGVG